MDKFDDKHLEQLAKMHSITDYSWHSWNSPIGLTIGLLGLVLCLNGLVLVAILIKSLFVM